MPTRKIADPSKFCRHPEHRPPTAMVYEPGTYEHVCPGCGARRVFVVPLMTLSESWSLKGTGPKQTMSDKWTMN